MKWSMFAIVPLILAGIYKIVTTELGQFQRIVSMKWETRFVEI